MDIPPYELPLPEPPASPEAGPVKPNLPIGGISGDPLCQILGQLEASIEKTVLIPDMYPDSLCRTLDKLEASIERQSPIIDRSPDPLQEILSRIENETEHQLPMAPKHSQDSPEEITLAMQDGFPQVNRQSRLPFAPSQKPEAFHREPLSLRQYPEPMHRMTGHSTGIRNSGNGFDWYCNIRQEWVSKDECDDCPDFEETDYDPDDKEDKRCRHSFSTFFDEQNKTEDKDTVSEEQADE
jgi:hypothetical protein